ncbi:glycosyltransferase family 4 protein [Patescibacteria group bacterium]|nr:glycosyltransferase family 4 protein [Patescibacteria group bacterium]MBU4512443.1 glycosyltransferase family 4 protein [Patescibacteria group bacterium]MCG2692571.1 glycosyltransferase family 4 protein [Candidatus Parcubacteria bacterium]
MKIAIITSTFPPYRGGIGNVAYQEARELARLGNQVTIFTPRYDTTQDKVQKVDGLIVKRLFSLLKFGNAAFLPQLLWSLGDFNVWYLHYPFFGGAEIVWLLKKFKKSKKIIIRYHMDVVGRGSLEFFFNAHSRYIMPKIIKSADRVIVSSYDYAHHSNIKELISGNQKKFTEIPFGVDLKSFIPSSKDDLFLDELGVAAEDKIAMFIGTLDKAHYFKGVEILLQAFSLLEDRPYKLVIVGEGDLRSHYEKMAEKLGITKKVIFAGAPSDRDLPAFYNIADVVVLPSIDKSEAFGLVLIEAMACAKPVIASDLAGVRSVVEDGVNGFLVKPKNTGELANRIDYVLSNIETAKQMGGRGREKVERVYNWERVGQDLSRILHELFTNCNRIYI